LVSKCESESEESDNDGRECKQEKMIRSLWCVVSQGVMCHQWPAQGCECKCREAYVSLNLFSFTKCTLLLF
jgi:hypothetical protein